MWSIYTPISLGSEVSHDLPKALLLPLGIWQIFHKAPDFSMITETLHSLHLKM